MRQIRKNDLNESAQFERHPPERRYGAGGRVFCNGGCCCCCCCLHSLGGLVGAAIVTAKGRKLADRSVINCYWIVLTLFSAAIALYSMCGESGVLGIVGLITFLPLVQLAASLATAIWIGARTNNPEDKKKKLLMLGRITLWSLLGAIVGLVIMVIGSKMFS